MKDYIYQFYNEGFATTFCLKPINYLNKKIKNKNVLNILSFGIKLFYTVGVLILAWIVFMEKYPL